MSRYIPEFFSSRGEVEGAHLWYGRDSSHVWNVIIPHLERCLTVRGTAFPLLAKEHQI